MTMDVILRIGEEACWCNIVWRRQAFLSMILEKIKQEKARFGSL
jgi:hypothetical protein